MYQPTINKFNQAMQKCRRDLLRLHEAPYLKEDHREVHLFNAVWMYKHGDRSDALYDRMVRLIGGK